MTSFENELNSVQHVNKGVSMRNMGFNPTKKVWERKDEKGNRYDEITGKRLQSDYGSEPVDWKGEISDDMLNDAIDNHTFEQKLPEMRSRETNMDYEPFFDVNSATLMRDRDNELQPENLSIGEAQDLTNMYGMDKLYHSYKDLAPALYPPHFRELYNAISKLPSSKKYITLYSGDPNKSYDQRLQERADDAGYDLHGRRKAEDNMMDGVEYLPDYQQGRKKELDKRKRWEERQKKGNDEERNRRMKADYDRLVASGFKPNTWQEF